jgi:hypothetical protein
MTTSIGSKRHAASSSVQAQTNDSSTASAKKMRRTVMRRPPAPTTTTAFIASTFSSRSASRTQVPRDWQKFEPADAARELKKIANEGDSLSLELSHGKSLLLDSTDYGNLLKSGALTLFKNPKESRSDPDDETALQHWIPGYHLTINSDGPLGSVASRLESLGASSREISDNVNSSLDKLRIASAKSDDMSVSASERAQLKQQVRSELPRAQKAVADFKQAQANWQGEKSALENSHQGADERKFVADVLRQSEPTVDTTGPSLDDVANLSKADQAILSRPEVLSVEPIDGLRITLDSAKIVQDGGSVQGTADELKKALGQAGVDGKLEFDSNVGASEIQNLARDQVLAPALGSIRIAQQGQGNNMISFGFHAADWDAVQPLKSKVQDFVNKFDEPGHHLNVEFDKVGY